LQGRYVYNFESLFMGGSGVHYGNLILEGRCDWGYVIGLRIDPRDKGG